MSIWSEAYFGYKFLEEIVPRVVVMIGVSLWVGIGIYNAFRESRRKK